MKNNYLRKPLAFCSLLACGFFVASPLLGNVVVNPNFNQGAGNLGGYEAFAEWFQPAGAVFFSSAWALADAPVTANGGGTAVFSMNTSLALADPFWNNATQTMSFQQNFWTPDNTLSITPTLDLYNQTLTFTGIAQVTQAYAPGNVGRAFIQFLDQDFNAVAFVSVDVSTLGPTGAFSLTANAPASGLNIIQIGFRNFGIEGTAGQMTVSNLSLVPEPGSLALTVVGALLVGLIRRGRVA